MKKIVLLLSMFGALFGAEIIEMSKEQQEALGIQTQRAQKAEMMSIGKFSAKVSSGSSSVVVVDARFEGVVEQIYVQNYEQVKKNQPLLRLKSSWLVMLQKEYIEEHLALKAAKKNYKRDKRLQTRGVISQKRLLASKNSYKTQLAAFELSKERLILSGFSEAMLERIAQNAKIESSLDIYAPQSGELFELSVMRGEYLQPSTPLLKILTQGESFMDIAVPVELAEQISIGDICAFENHRCKVVSVSKRVDALSQSIIVRAKIEDGALLQMDRIYDVVLQKSQTQALKIEKSSLIYKEGRALLFVRHAGGFMPLGIEVLSEQSEHYLINEERLSSSDEIAVSGTAALLSAMESSHE